MRAIDQPCSKLLPPSGGGREGGLSDDPLQLLSIHFKIPIRYRSGSYGGRCVSGRDADGCLPSERGSGHRVGSGGDLLTWHRSGGSLCYPLAQGGSLIRQIREVGLKPPAEAASTENKGSPLSPVCAPSSLYRGTAERSRMGIRGDGVHASLIVSNS